MKSERMMALAQALAAAKSRQDVAEALTVLHPEMRLETPAFGSIVCGLEANERALTRFFATFPDYEVALQGHAANSDSLICWGHVKMTMTGDRFGETPNGRRAELPVFIEFNFKDDRISRERFYFDLADLCSQSGVSTDIARQKLFGAADAHA